MGPLSSGHPTWNEQIFRVNEQIPKPQRLLTWWEASKIERRRKVIKRLLLASMLVVPIATDVFAEAPIRCVPGAVSLYCPNSRDILERYGYRTELTPVWKPAPTQATISIAADGHFYPLVTINGVRLSMMADTGATPSFAVGANPRWEPYARIGPVRICAGGAQ
jgi:hypothetical protein